MRIKINYQINEKNYYERNRDVLLERSKIYQQNRKSHTQQIKDLNNKIDELTQALETIILKKLNRFIRICKWQSLTMCIVKFVKDSIQKNMGTNISNLVGIYIGKSMVIGQHFFHNEN